MRQAFAAYFHTSVAAIRQAEARVLIIGLSASDLDLLPDKDLLMLPFAPYSAIFPHCAAIIQHGGIGTIAQALRFGVPALVVPWGMDQLYSANQLAQLGAGAYLPWSRFTVDRAAPILNEFLQTSRFRKAAQRLRDQIAGEDGAAAICTAIEQQLAALQASVQTQQHLWP